MRTLIAMAVIIFFSTSIVAQEPDVEQLVNDQNGIELFDAQAFAKSFNLTDDQVAKIEVINAEVSTASETVTQESYNKKLSKVISNEQVAKWQQSIATDRRVP